MIESLKVDYELKDIFALKLKQRKGYTRISNTLLFGGLSQGAMYLYLNLKKFSEKVELSESYLRKYTKLKDDKAMSVNALRSAKNELIKYKLLEIKKTYHHRINYEWILKDEKGAVVKHFNKNKIQIILEAKQGYNEAEKNSKTLLKNAPKKFNETLLNSTFSSDGKLNLENTKKLKSTYIETHVRACDKNLNNINKNININNNKNLENKNINNQSNNNLKSKLNNISFKNLKDLNYLDIQDKEMDLTSLNPQRKGDFVSPSASKSANASQSYANASQSYANASQSYAESGESEKGAKNSFLEIVVQNGFKTFLANNETKRGQEMKNQAKVRSSKGQGKKTLKTQFIEPSLEQVQSVVREFNKEHNCDIDLIIAKNFISYYKQDDGKWRMSNGKLLKDWKRALINTWLYKRMNEKPFEAKFKSKKQGFEFESEEQKERVFALLNGTYAEKYANDNYIEAQIL